MKRQSLSVCLLLSLLGAGQAWSGSPAAPAGAPTPMEGELRRVSAEANAQAKQIDPEGRLTSDQLYRLIRDREGLGSQSDPTPGVVCVTFFGSLLMGFLAWLWAGDRKARRVHETVRLMVEKGTEIPQGLLAPPPRPRASDLRRGIILSATGAGLTLLLALLSGAEGAWGAGVTLMLIGLGHLLVWRLQRGRGGLASALAPELQS